MFVVLINYVFSSSTTFLWQLIKLQILQGIKSTNVITRKVNTGNYSNQNNWSPVPTLNYEINDRVRWPVLTFHNYWSIHSCQKVVVAGTNGGNLNWFYDFCVWKPVADGGSWVWQYNGVFLMGEITIYHTILQLVSGRSVIDRRSTCTHKFLG